MTIEKAKQIIDSAKHHGDMTPLDQALYAYILHLEALILDLAHMKQDRDGAK